MSSMSDILLGFSIALAPINLMYCFIGVVLGTLIGVLPGLGPTAGLAILIPMTAGLLPATALIMLAGLYFGAMYGGSTTSILLNVPGEAASVITCLDGYQMARKGRAGPALGISAISSFVAGTVSIFLLVFLMPPLTKLALIFGPPEYFSLMLFGITILVSITGKSLIKGLIAGMFGMLIAMVGIDPMTGMMRFTLRNPNLIGGVHFITVVVGLFAISEILINIESSIKAVYEGKLKNIFPGWDDLRRSAGAIFRGTFVGFFVGALPGGSPTIASFVAYDLEKKCSKNPEKFGTGEIEGVAAPEGANNSAAEAGLVPLLALGVPGCPTIAVLMGAFLIQGLIPGPLLFKDAPEVVWGLIASMYIGNAMLLVINLPLVGIWASIVKVPYYILAPVIMAISVLGAYTVNNRIFDVWLMLIFGVIGYFMKKLNFPHAPVVLAMILAPLLENALRQSLVMSKGDLSIFISRPISAAFLLVAIVSILLSLYSRMRKSKKADEFFQASTEV